MYPPHGTHDETLDESEESGLTRTCHLCGKAQCGQRKGRVRCAYCKRIFCLQQLYKKFKIKASVDDKNFKCPRCLGICCCVCNCQKPPPHVHCKVYKVRQTKRKSPMNTMEITPSFPPIMPATPDVVPKVEMSPTPNLSAPLVEYSPPRQSVPPSLPTGIQDQQIPSYSYSTEIPGSTCMRQFPMRSSAQRLADTAESADARQSGHQRFHPPLLFQYRYQSHGRPRYAHAHSQT